MKPIPAVLIGLTWLFSMMLAIAGPDEAVGEAQIREFTEKVIKTRDVRSVLHWFCSEEEFLKQEDIGATESAKKLNFLIQRDLFAADCAALMNLLPMAGLKSLKIQSVSKEETNGKEPARLKVTYVYDEDSPARFSISFPVMIPTAKGLKFSSRFPVLLKHEI
jgi:hypothetical protein